METKNYLLSFIRFFSLIFIIFFLHSCNQAPNEETTSTNEDYTESNESPSEVETSPEGNFGDDDSPVVAAGNPTKPDLPVNVENPEEGYAPNSNDTIATNPDKSSAVPLDNYKIILATNEKIFKNQTCELKIWIGAEKMEVSFSEGMITDQTSIPASIGQYAKITPYAPDFEISPAQMTCVKIDPSGSEVRFTLTPKSSGKFKVSANIELFNNPDCTGPAIPKTAKTLSVTVTTDRIHEIREALKEMGEVVWDKFMSFWGIVITLFFAAALFVVRRFIKEKTGYDDKTLEN